MNNLNHKDQISNLIWRAEFAKTSYNHDKQNVLTSLYNLRALVIESIRVPNIKDMINRLSVRVAKL